MRFCLVVLIATIAMVLNGCSSSPPPISVSLSTTSSNAVDEGSSLTLVAKVTNDLLGQGVTWTLKGPGSLSSSTTPTVIYEAPTASLSSAEQVTVIATSVADRTKSASLTITVNPYLVITNIQQLASGTVGAPYNQPITFTGGTAPFQWSIFNGSTPIAWKVGAALPDGLTLDPVTGIISGTPTAAGTWYFDAIVTDADGANASDWFLSIQVNPASASRANSVPFLNQPLAPAAVAPGGAGISLGVTGTGFVPGATVDFDGVPLTTTFVDSGHLNALVPANEVANAKTVSVTTVNPAPGGGRSNVVYFQVGAQETTVSFANAANSPLQIPEPVGLAIADFNEDGKPDLAIAGAKSAFVLLGKGDGTFTQPAGVPIHMPSPPYDDGLSPYSGPAIVAGDFDSSGHQGLAVGLFQNQAVVTLFGKGDGTFTYADTLANALGYSVMWITAADFNADGSLDMAVSNSSDGESPAILLGYSSGAFIASSPQTPVYGICSAAGDFNSDGKLDLAIGSSILLGNGDGTFSQGNAANPGGLWIAAGDFNGDGNLDLAVTNRLNTVTILLGDGKGGFAVAPGSPVPVGNQPWGIVTGDFNNDGKLDLAVANFGDNTVTLLLGNGYGTFTEASGSPWAVGKAPEAIVTADFNGDGKLDLAVANSLDGTGTVSILLQQ